MSLSYRRMDDMEEEIIKLIKNEDIKKPLTDEQIAMKLNILRENVTNTRKKYDIPDSRSRRRGQLIKDVKSLVGQYGGISNRKLTKLLNNMGYDVGKYAIGKLRDEVLKNKGGIPKADNQQYFNENSNEAESDDSDDIFSEFIGYDGSLKGQITRAKAAVSYPPHGLHTLIYGPSGVGKSFLAELMYKYAVENGNFGKDAPFFEFNCADYADNPQLLLAQLFGYAKGAFTGAVEDKKGIVELSDGGILFLDEVHRLPAKGQEMLLYLIDKGKFRRLGETDIERKSNVMIIAATTENPESSLLLTFRRRIPMFIEIPPIKDRPINEKVQLIKSNFMMESRRIGRELQVKENVLKCMLSMEYLGNVGQLKSDIQVSCAKAFLDAKKNHTENIVVEIDSLPKVLSEDYNNSEWDKYDSVVHGDTFYLPDENSVYEQSAVEQSKNIYDQLDRQYERMKKEGLSESEINETLSRQLEKFLFHHIKNVQDSKFSLQEISNIVGDKVLNITNEIYEISKSELPYLKNTIIFPLAIHLNMAIQRARINNAIKYSKLNIIKNKSTKEYEVAKKALKIIKCKYGVQFLEEEIGFLAMYFSNFQGHNQVNKERIGLLVVSHGKVACGMVETANAIMGTDYAVGLEMDLKDSPSVMINKVINMIEHIDHGKGCIILADMGSLTTMGERIENETGIHVRIVGRVDTLMVMEGIRKVLWTDETADEIADELDTKNKSTLQTKVEIESKIKKKAILCLCITGKGAAKLISEHIKNRLKGNLKNIEVLAKGYIDEDKVENIIEPLENDYKIIAVVGTIDPQIDRYPFISSTEIFKPEGIARLRKIVKHNTLFEGNKLSDVIHPENVFVNPEYTYKDEVLDNAINILIKNGFVKPDFLLSVYKRESLMTTYLQGGIAIPHGSTEFVTKPAISITKLDTPIIWDGVNSVDIIFILALDENSKVYFNQLYNIISDESLLSAIHASNSKSEILHILCPDTKSAR